ncbi:hypothetical protein BCEP27_30919 [Burkholderia cepacia]
MFLSTNHRQSAVTQIKSLHLPKSAEFMQAGIMLNVVKVYRRHQQEVSTASNQANP